MGCFRGGLANKIHALVAAEGRPVVLRLSVGQVRDCFGAEAVLEEALGEGGVVFADKGYDGNVVRERAKEKKLGPIVCQN